MRRTAVGARSAPDQGHRLARDRQLLVGRDDHDEGGLDRLVRLGRLVRDVTPRKEWEERQAMLMGELNHRVKNTLATVQSIASQTLLVMTAGGFRAGLSLSRHTTSY